MIVLFVLASALLQASLQGAAEATALREFTLTSSVTTPVTKHISTNINLRCEKTAGGESKFAEIFDFRIEKQSADGSWERFAAISGHSKVITIDSSDATADGNIVNGITGSYLEINWPVAKDDTIGIFRCVVVGMSSDLEAETDITVKLKIAEKVLGTAEVLEMFLDLKRTNDEKISNVKSHIQDVSTTFATNWPRGNYVLLQPNTGCPDEPAFRNGETGAYNLHTESSGGVKPQTTMSDGIHLSEPVLERLQDANILHLRFCSASVEVSSHHWPSGAYCINRQMPRNCPVGFSLGSNFLRVDEEDEMHQGSRQGSFLGSGEEFHFCCKNTGSSTESINLPTNSPFYLYRFGGTCQNVAGMSVTEEYILIDTEDGLNHDEQVGIVPDSSIDKDTGKLRLELCYYSA